MVKSDLYLGKILTDAGEILKKLTEYNLPSTIWGSRLPTRNVFNLPVRVSGIDTDNTGNLIATNRTALFNLGTAPYSTIVSGS
jgi:hypothetical protein